MRTDQCEELHPSIFCHKLCDSKVWLIIFNPFQINFYELFYFMWMSILPECMYVSGALRNQKRVSDSMKLELQTVVRYHVHSGNWTCSSAKAASSILDQRAISSSPQVNFYDGVQVYIYFLTHVCLVFLALIGRDCPSLLCTEDIVVSVLHYGAITVSSFTVVFLVNLFILHVGFFCFVFCLHVFLYTTCISGAQRG